MIKDDKPAVLNPGDTPPNLPPLCFVEMTDTDGKSWFVNPARTTFAHVATTSRAKGYYEVYTPDTPMFRTERNPLAVSNPRLVPSI